jgi:hypothetical protein
MKNVIAFALLIGCASASATTLEGINHNTQEAQQNLEKNKALLDSTGIKYDTFTPVQNATCQNPDPIISAMQERLMDIALEAGRPRSEGIIDQKTRAEFAPIAIKSCYAGIVSTQHGTWANTGLSMRLKVENVETQALHPIDKANAVGMRAAYEAFVAGHNVANK